MMKLKRFLNLDQSLMILKTKTFSDKALIDSIEEAMMKETPDKETEAPDETEEVESDSDDILSDIENETGETLEEETSPTEEAEPAEGEIEELPPMLGTMPEE